MWVLDDQLGLEVIAQMDVAEVDLITACDAVGVDWVDFMNWLSDFDPEHELLYGD